MPPSFYKYMSTDMFTIFGLYNKGSIHFINDAGHNELKIMAA